MLSKSEQVVAAHIEGSHSRPNRWFGLSLSATLIWNAPKQNALIMFIGISSPQSPVTLPYGREKGPIMITAARATPVP